jgi:cellulose biosynthesis protein BcsQ
MKESDMENEKIPLYVAFSTQKGGVGKTTFTALAAGYLYYLKGYDVAVVDCDSPQHSIAGMRKRDAEQVGADEDYKRMAYEQFTRLGKKSYPVLCSSPEKAIVTADEYVATAGHVPDIVFFDLPGTVNSGTP